MDFRGLLLVLIFASGCSDSRVAQDRPDVPRADMEQVSSRSVGVSVPDFPPPTVRIGTLSDEDGHAFGLVRDAKLLFDDRVVVLDGRRQELSVFSREGRVLQLLGGPGRGPGEYLVPERLAMDEEHLWVSDPANGRINVYGVDRSRVELVGSFSPDVIAMDICSIGGSLVVLGLFEGRILHVFKNSGEHIRSFGIPPPIPKVDERFRSLMTGSLTDGRLACVDDRIVVVHRNLPALTAFSIDGEVIWESEVADYRQMKIRQTEKGRISYDVEDETGTHHTAFFLMPVGTSRVVLQLGIIGRGARADEYQALDTRLISLEDGSEVGRTRAWPLLATIGNRLVVTYENQPFPQIAIHSLPSLSELEGS
jgi:6-bladed beta-propeller protein